MTKLPLISLRLFRACSLAFALPALAQVPDTLLHAIPRPASAAGSGFSYSVAISGTHMVVGMYGNSTAASNAGNAYIYDLTSGTPTEPVMTLNNPSPAANDNFGWSVAIDGTRVVVGAWGDDTGASNAGSAYVYDLSSSTPTVPVTTLNNPSAASSDSFGWSVAISGTKVVVGAYGDSAGAVGAGSAYVYDLTSATPTVPMAILNNPGPAPSDGFGWSVAISSTKVVVGAYKDDTGAIDAGSAYVYDLASGTPTAPVATLTNPSPDAYDEFGYSVAISGNRVVVGAVDDDTGATDTGRAYVYDLSSGTPTTPVAELDNPSPGAADEFGWSVAMSGTRVVVGAHSDSTVATSAGSAYVYDLTSATPTVPVATLNSPSQTTRQGFGESAAIDGTTIAIGTRNLGKAFVFGPSNPDSDGDGLLDMWEYASFGTATGHNPLDDSDHDGLCELLEFALGMNPTKATPVGLPAAVEESGYLTMTLTKQSGVLYEIQSAGTLLPGQPDSFSAASTTVITNNATTLKVRDNFLLSTTPNRFMRVKVTAAP